MTTIHIPTPSEDVIDSRDVLTAIDEIVDGNVPPAEWDDALLLLLHRLDDEGRDASEDWQYGATLIRDDYFTHYAMELADDMGVDVGSLSWPLNCIDWAQAAFELKMDYTPVQFGHVTYWVR
jgi:hypothetical protein